MSQTVDFYAVLGVRPGATTADIRARYRQLVRAYHPDVAVDKLAAHEHFVRIVDAYRTLSDDQRRALYDRSRQAAQQAVAAAQYSWEEELRRHSTDALIVTAELFFIRGQMRLGIEQCKRIIAQDPNSGAAHGVLGDFLRRVGARDEALHCYTMAAQLTGNPRLYERKIENLLKGQDEEEEEPPRPATTVRIARAFGVAALILACVPFGLLLSMNDRDALWTAVFPAANVVMAATSCGFLVGCALALLRWLEHADEEIFAVSFASSGGALPIGVWLLLTGLLSFYLAIASYAVIAIFEEHVSWSVVKAFTASALLVTALAIVLSDHYAKVALWGGNVVFPSLLVGWSLGSMGRSRW